MKLGELRDRIPDFGRDIRLNLESTFAGEQHVLSPRQLYGTGLACAYALNSGDLVSMLLEEGQAHLDEALKTAAKAAASIMAMNNVYYRSMHLMEDAELKKLPARLRMNVIGKPGIPKDEFELMSFGISALAGCGQCLTAHLNELRKAAIADEVIQGALKIAAVLNAVSATLKISAL